MKLSHHQHVKDDDRRQRQDHRPDADGPDDVFGGKALLSGVVMRRRIILIVQDRPRDFFAYGLNDTRDVLKFRAASALAF